MSQYLCPECQADSNVLDTRPSYNRLRRRRACKAGHKFSTIEVPITAPEAIADLVRWILEEAGIQDEDMVLVTKTRARELLLGLEGE